MNDCLSTQKYENNQHVPNFFVRHSLSKNRQSDTDFRNYRECSLRHCIQHAHLLNGYPVQFYQSFALLKPFADENGVQIFKKQTPFFVFPQGAKEIFCLFGLLACYI